MDSLLNKTDSHNTNNLNNNPLSHDGDKYETSYRLIIVAAYAVFFSVINNTMFNVAVPGISHEFNLLPSQVSWVVVGYTTLFALSSISFGKLADIYPLKRLITIGLLLFNLGSFLGFLAPNYGVLLTARLLQASGAGAIPALSMLIAMRFYPPVMRGKVLGVNASIVAFGSGIGPVLGGFVAFSFSWHYLFLISMLSLIAIFFFNAWLPLEEVKNQKLDIIGGIYLAGFIAATLVIINQFLWILIPVALIFLWLFVRHINAVEDPFIQPQLLANNLYRNSLIATFLATGSVFATFFMVPLMLGNHYGLASNQIGLIMFPGAMSAAVMGFLSGKAADKVGSLPVVFTGLISLIVGFLLMSTFAGYPTYVITLVLLVIYINFSFIQSSMSNTVSTTLSKNLTGVGMGLYNLVFFIAGGFTSALAGKALDYAEGAKAINPLALNDGSAIYSNISLASALVIAISAFIFFRTFRQTYRIDKSLSQDRQLLEKVGEGS